MRLLLDTCIVSRLCHPKKSRDEALLDWFEQLRASEASQLTICLPEIVDYETRRGLNHIARQHNRLTTRSLERLDQFGEAFEYLPLNTETMKLAADLWGRARAEGRAGADSKALDGDLILAAQARLNNGEVLTDNVRHLSPWCKTRSWQPQ